jgi:GNAT superfamily N-acetyltransferase
MNHAANPKGGDGFEVRTPRAEDAVALARLGSELGYPNSADQMSVRLEQLSARVDHWVGVATDRAGGALGWIHVGRSVTLETGEYAEIFGLVVASVARRGGLGRRLVRAAEEWARSAGFERITVRSNVLRSESHLFYPSLGFTRSKSQHVYVKSLAPQR